MVQVCVILSLPFCFPDASQFLFLSKREEGRKGGRERRREGGGKGERRISTTGGSGFIMHTPSASSNPSGKNKPSLNFTFLETAKNSYMCFSKQLFYISNFIINQIMMLQSL